MYVYVHFCRNFLKILLSAANSVFFDKRITLILKLRIKCSVTYLFCTRPHIFTGFLLYVSFSELFTKTRITGY